MPEGPCQAEILKAKWGDCAPVRIQAWMLVRLKVMPVLSRVTGSVMRQWLMGQKNSGGGGALPV